MKITLDFNEIYEACCAYVTEKTGATKGDISIDDVDVVVDEIPLNDDKRVGTKIEMRIREE